MVREMFKSIQVDHIDYLISHSETKISKTLKVFLPFD